MAHPRFYAIALDATAPRPAGLRLTRCRTVNCLGSEANPSHDAVPLGKVKRPRHIGLCSREEIPKGLISGVLHRVGRPRDREDSSSFLPVVPLQILREGVHVMRDPQERSIGRRGKANVRAEFEELGWSAAENPDGDIGTDLWLIPQDERRFDLQLFMGVQVKAGKSRFRRPRRRDNTVTGWWYAEEDGDHFDYWLGHAIPHLLVLHDLDASSHGRITSLWSRWSRPSFTPAPYASFSTSRRAGGKVLVPLTARLPCLSGISTPARCT
jgi:hypothetical protein